MTRTSNSEAYDMVPLLEGFMREIAGGETPKIVQDKTLTHDEKYKKISEIKNGCANRTAKFKVAGKELVLSLHRLSSSYKQGDIDRGQAYGNFLSEYVSGSIEKTLDLMNTELLGGYDHIVRRHKVLIQTIKENK